MRGEPEGRRAIRSLGFWCGYEREKERNVQRGDLKRKLYNQPHQFHMQPFGNCRLFAFNHIE